MLDGHADPLIAVNLEDLMNGSQARVAHRLIDNRPLRLPAWRPGVRGRVDVSYLIWATIAPGSTTVDAGGQLWATF